MAWSVKMAQYIPKRKYSRPWKRWRVACLAQETTGTSLHRQATVSAGPSNVAEPYQYVVVTTSPRLNIKLESRA